MAIPGIVNYHIPKFWDNSFEHLNYVNEAFNDHENLQRWQQLGYAEKFTGDMCDMRSPQPVWNQLFVKIFEEMGWQDVGTSYYRMGPGTILPTHSDLYVRYVDLFDLEGQESSIRRAIVFLRDWEPGHYAEYNDHPFTQWHAGDVMEWRYDTLHMAANMGTTPRYTLQVTGHVKT